MSKWWPIRDRNRYSKYSPQFNGNRLKRTLAGNGIRYVFLGTALGGRPSGDEFYDQQGRVLYPRIAKSPRFLAGLARVEKGLTGFKVALLCSEESPAICHRRLLVGRALADRGVAIDHVLGDGRLQSEEQFSIEEAELRAELDRQAEAERLVRVERRAEAQRRTVIDRRANAERRAETRRQAKAERLAQAESQAEAPRLVEAERLTQAERQELSQFGLFSNREYS